MSDDRAEPPRPVLRYREERSVVRYWALRAHQRCGGQFDLVAERDPAFRHFLRLELPDGRIFEDLSAVVRVQSEFGSNSLPLRLQFWVPSFFALIEWLLRRLLVRPADLLILPLQSAPDYTAACRLFIRAMGLVYLMAFLTAWPQLPGLIGQNGILPLDQFPVFGWKGINADIAVQVTCAIGAMAATCLLFRIASLASSLVAWLLYSLLITAGGDFFAYGFDYYILEAGFLAVLVAVFAGRHSRIPASPRILIWYIWWLLFRIFFFPLLNSISSPGGDTSLSQTRAYLMCQPLPTPFSWWLYQAPTWLLSAIASLTAGLTAIALLALLCGRRGRPVAGLLMIALNLWGMLQGNGALGGWITIALCLFCFDNRWLEWRKSDTSFEPQPLPGLFRPITIGTIAAMFWLISVLYIIEGYGWALPPTAESLLRRASQWRLMLSHVGGSRPINKRPELIIEGSVDGKNWLAYQFGWKPGRPTSAPRFACVYHPRLDWQMWFPFTGNSSYWLGSLFFNPPGQLGPYYEWKAEPMLLNFVSGLKRGQPEILELLTVNPFPQRPPRFIRLQLYDYAFSRMKERRKSGIWWRRKLLAVLNLDEERIYPYFPPGKVPSLKPAKPIFGPTAVEVPKAPKPATTIPSGPSTPLVNQTPVRREGPVNEKPGAH